MSAKIALTVSLRGIETISFLSSDKTESMAFYLLIQDELRLFEERVKALTQNIPEGGDHEEH